MNTLRWCVAFVDENFQKKQLPVSKTKDFNIFNIGDCLEM